MLPALCSTTCAAPLLHLGLQRIARTPGPRLQVGYRVGPRSAPPGTCEQGTAWLGTPGVRLNALPLGAKIDLFRLLTGGVVGERLRLANPICQAAVGARLPCGLLIDRTV